MNERDETRDKVLHVLVCNACGFWNGGHWIVLVLVGVDTVTD